ncbi:DNA-binding protein [Sulfitobacter alexandrii]|uniref:DNA-binding protein n=1 Tax=Sulfitobacter alexandrii TaxID=1917485 RepID=A0A1J0WGY3_9RHOB|nr:helix-turn-helix domain-containing protein [Sulfitobacter alexandrii]APE43390.1 DNA-binding protein [Sulfitobacter alexandrii]
MPALSFIPRLMPAPQAAHYLGVSESKLRCLKLPRKVLDGKRLYDRIELDAYADNLATEGGIPGSDMGGGNSCDDIFGMAPE